jgi:hypothetical protein
MKKNSITNWVRYGADLPIALTPCLKDKCDLWRGGECSQISKAGKPDRPQLFSKQDQ